MRDVVVDAALVREVLARPEGRPWRMSAVGLMGLRLDESGEHRLHVWDPAGCTDPEPIHDHPFDFTSTVITGVITNTIYVEDPAGVLYQRDRYEVDDEGARRSDEVRLRGRSAVHVAGDRYAQRAHELHASSQVPGTVTLLRRTFVDRPTLTVCRPPGSPWASGQARAAEPDEVRRLTAAALALLA